MAVLKFMCLLIVLSALTGCASLYDTSKYEFNDGIYYTKILSKKKNRVYVYKVNEDTIAVYPVLEFPDSTSIQLKKKTTYTSLQKKFKDGKTTHTFYKPSLDIDVMTIPLLYRPAASIIPNQLTANFNGAIYVGYRTDAYTLEYTRTPFNTYEQEVKHYGFSAGLFAGLGSALINDYFLRNISTGLEYQGVTLTYGLGANMALENINFGISVGLGHLLDKYHEYWIYEQKPFIGFTLGLNIN